MSDRTTLLGLPVRDRAAALATTAFASAVLLATMARSVGLFDAGELAVAAFELGLGHPPGQPLHALLGHLFCLLPGIDPAVGLTALSAIAGALCVIPAWSLSDAFAPEPRARWVAPTAILAVVLHGVHWEHATRIEVYPLAVLFGLWAIARSAALTDDAGTVRESAAVGLALGLSACANPVIAFIAALSSACFLFAPGRAALRRIPAVVGGGLLGLLPYAYLALVAGREDAFVWGGLDTTREVVDFVTGHDFSRNLSTSIGTRLAQASELLDYLASERGASMILVAGLLGVVVGLRTRRLAPAGSLIVGLLLPLALVSSNVVFAVDVPDYLGYLALPFLLLASASVAAIVAAQRRTRAAFLLPLVLVTSTVLSSPIAWQRTRARDDIPMRLARELLDEAPAGAIVVVDSDHFAGPLLYAQRVERLRPDVIVVIRGLMSSAWYVRMLARQHHDLRAYAVRGAGGREGRIRRLLEANAQRSVRLENLDLANELGLVACAGGLTLRAGVDCGDHPTPSLAGLARIAERAHRLPSGSVESRMVLPAVTFRLGLDLYRLGLPQEAYAVLMLGLPSDYRRGRLPPPSEILPIDRLMRSSFPFRRARAIGEPARNAFVAAMLLARSGEVEAAVQLLGRAAADGLPEAEEMLQRSSR